MRTASQLPGGEPTDVDDAPALHLCVNLNAAAAANDNDDDIAEYTVTNV